MPIHCSAGCRPASSDLAELPDLPAVELGIDPDRHLGVAAALTLAGLQRLLTHASRIGAVLLAGQLPAGYGGGLYVDVDAVGKRGC